MRLFRLHLESLEPTIFLRNQISDACKNYNACDTEEAQMGFNRKKENIC